LHDTRSVMKQRRCQNQFCICFRSDAAARSPDTYTCPLDYRGERSPARPARVMNAARSSKLSLKSIYSRFVAGRASGRGGRARAPGRGGISAASGASQVRREAGGARSAGDRARDGGSSDYLFARGEIKFALLRPRVRPRGIRPLIASFLFLASPLLTPRRARRCSLLHARHCIRFPFTRRADLCPRNGVRCSRAREPRYFSKRCFTTYAP